ncbi:Clp protease N-terminal domain-containing protein [Dactylosporangium sp. NPDC051541]|uniref:Clp protease N-terminal domain-containing protein n=1 Tax=Dactylosporangium sp. NPDC051541 TaxID=3363977 RepID=UPI00379FD28B
MPKINVYLPEELAEAVKATGVPVSAICQRALEQAVRRVTAIRETVLGELDDHALAARLPHLTGRVRTVLRLAAEKASGKAATNATTKEPTEAARKAATKDNSSEETGTATAVGTGHLLTGMLDEGGNLALHVLRAIDIDPARIPSVLKAGPEAGPAGQFSAPAAAALELAVTEATALGHNYVGCEHLLLGLVAEPDGAAGQALRSLGAELRLTRRAVTAALAGYVHLQAQAPSLDALLARIERLESRLQ